MIKASELRIGNTVNWIDPLDKQTKIINIDCDDLSLICKSNHGNDYSGIELTLEVLEQCGFVYSEKGNLGRT